MVLRKKTKSNQDTYIYCLKQSRSIVYYGITNNPNRRLEEHRVDGKVFTKMEILNQRAMKKENAEIKERSLLRAFNNKYGKLPMYNVSSSGQYVYGGSKQAKKKIVNRIKQVNKHKR